MKTAKVLCITLIDNVYHCLTVHGKGSLHFGKDLSGRALFTDEPRVVASPDELNALCSRAAEIHISAPFPSAVYQLPQLPRVAKRYMPNLVSRNAQQTMGVEDPIHVRYMPVRDVTDGGVSKRETAYCAVLASEIQALWDTFEDHRSKIKSLVPLPVAIASMVSRLENPPDTFAVACTGKEDTILVIASPAGFVYVARSIPLTLPASRPATRTGEARIRETDADADTMDESLLDMDTSLAPQSVETPESRFSKELARELDMTVTFFKQEFRKPAPGRIYLLGESQIESIVHEHPLPPAYEEVHFGLDVESLRGLDRTFAAQNIRTLGNLFIPDAFNFVPAQEMARRRFSVALNAAVIVLAAGLGLAAFWSFDQSRSMALAKEEHARQLTRLQETQNRVAELEADVNRLKPVENWKQFYDETIGDPVPWNRMISELALTLEDHVLITSFQVEEGEEGKDEQRDCKVQGKIKADDWETGLALFREFGNRVHASPLFKVSAITYAPETITAVPSMFDFQMDITLTSGDIDS